MREKAFAAVALGAIITGMSGLLIKNMSIPATSMAWIRTTIPTVVLGLWLAFNGVQFFRGSKRFLLTVSGLNAARMYFFFLTYTLTSIGNAVIILYTGPYLLHFSVF
jgi:drug/metabolite transporter (DMT)-like permease